MYQNMCSIINLSHYDIELMSKLESLGPTVHSNTLIIRVSDDGIVFVYWGSLHTVYKTQTLTQ